MFTRYPQSSSASLYSRLVTPCAFNTSLCALDTSIPLIPCFARIASRSDAVDLPAAEVCLRTSTTLASFAGVFPARTAVCAFPFY